MGQRASVIKFNRKGEAIITTLQWSTYLDQNIAAELRANPEGRENSTAAKVINSIIKGSGHLSAVEYTENPSGYGALGKVLRGYGHQGKGNQNIGVKSYVEAALCRLNGGAVGVISDLRKPGVLTFFWEDDKMGVNFHEVTPAELRKAGGVPVTFNRW